MARLFLKSIAPDYKPPDRKKVRASLAEAAQEMDVKLVETLRSAGPWVLSADGATIDHCGFFNVLASDLNGRCIHLAHCSTVDMDATTEALMDLLRPWTDISTVVAVCADNAANIQAAVRRLSANSQRPLFALRCQEHGAQLLLKDIREGMPFIRRATQDIHQCIKWLRRSKKLFGKVKAAGIVIQHRRKTRHNSWTSMTLKWLQHKVAVVRIARAHGVERLGHTEKQRRKAARMVQTWEHHPLEARARRLAPVLFLVSQLSRSLACARLPEALNLWKLAERQLREAFETADFRDTDETEAQVRARRDELRQILRKRLDMFL